MLKLEMDGKVFIVEEDEHGLEISREEIRTDIALRILRMHTEEAIRSFCCSEECDGESK